SGRRVRARPWVACPSPSSPVRRTPPRRPSSSTASARRWSATRCSWCRRRPTPSATGASWPPAVRSSGRASCGSPGSSTRRRGALDALRVDPAAWGATPVFFYGFDDLTPLERDAVETLAGRVGADVTVSLSYEPGRLAFAGRARTFEELRPLADRVVALEPRA